MADIIYCAIGLAIMAYGAALLAPGRRVLHSVEWLNTYAIKKLVPPRDRVNFEHVAMWLSFTSLSTIWLIFGVLLQPLGAVSAACLLNLFANYMITKLSGCVRIKVTRYKTWLLVSASMAYCIWRLYVSVLHQ